MANRHLSGYTEEKWEITTTGSVRVNRLSSIARVLHQLKWRSIRLPKDFQHETSMDVGRRDGVSKTVSSSDFAHMLHERVHEGTQVNAEVALGRKRRDLGLERYAHVE